LLDISFRAVLATTILIVFAPDLRRPLMSTLYGGFQTEPAGLSLTRT